MLEWYCVIQVLDGFSSPTYFGEKSNILQSFKQRHLNIQREKKNVWQQKAKNALLQLTQKMKLEHKRSSLRSFVSIILPKICFSCLDFFTFGYLSWATLCDVAFSDYYKSIVSCWLQRIQNFNTISTHCGTMTWANDMQQCDNNRNDNDDDDDDCLIMIMILPPCCAR